MSRSAWVAGALAVAALYYVGTQDQESTPSRDQASREARLDKLQAQDRIEATRLESEEERDTAAALARAEFQDTQTEIDSLERSGAVCGVVQQVEHHGEVEGSPTFIDLNYAYPDPRRSVILVWEEDYDDVSEKIARIAPGERACGLGTPKRYRGVLTAEAAGPGEIVHAPDPESVPAGNHPDLLTP